jgi:hypothetical protein
LRGIKQALHETYVYCRGIENGGSRDPDMEAQLAHYWAAAAIPVRKLNGELAARCDRKSEYWINPERYSDQDLQDLGIELRSVRQEYQELLSGFRGTVSRKHS